MQKHDAGLAARQAAESVRQQQQQHNPSAFAATLDSQRAHLPPLQTSVETSSAPTASATAAGHAGHPPPPPPIAVTTTHSPLAGIPTTGITATAASSAATTPPPSGLPPTSPSSTPISLGPLSPTSADPVTPTSEKRGRRAKDDPNAPNPGSNEWIQQKRESHKNVERRRRQVINVGINELARIVPNCSEKNKGTIIQLAVRYIQHLRENETRMLEQIRLEKMLAEESVKDLESRIESLLSEIKLYKNKLRDYNIALPLFKAPPGFASSDYAATTEGGASTSATSRGSSLEHGKAAAASAVDLPSSLGPSRTPVSADSEDSKVGILSPSSPSAPGVMTATPNDGTIGYSSMRSTLRKNQNVSAIDTTSRVAHSRARPSAGVSSPGSASTASPDTPDTGGGERHESVPSSSRIPILKYSTTQGEETSLRPFSAGVAESSERTTLQGPKSAGPQPKVNGTNGKSESTPATSEAVSTSTSAEDLTDSIAMPPPSTTASSSTSRYLSSDAGRRALAAEDYYYTSTAHGTVRFSVTSTAPSPMGAAERTRGMQARTPAHRPPMLHDFDGGETPSRNTGMGRIEAPSLLSSSLLDDEDPDAPTTAPALPASVLMGDDDDAPPAAGFSPHEEEEDPIKKEIVRPGMDSEVDPDVPGVSAVTALDLLGKHDRDPDPPESDDSRKRIRPS